MTTQRFIRQASARSRLLPGIALLWVLTLVLGLIQPVQAQSAIPGDVIAWGWNVVGQTDVPTGLTGVIAISGGDLHSLALKSDGTVVGWGFNSDGQATTPAGLSNVIAIAAGGYHNLALRANGTVVAWGRNFQGPLNIPAGLSGVVAIAAGPNQSMALKADGTVVGWGDNRFGQLAIPAGLSGVTAIAAGSLHGLALKSDGTVVAWGDNGNGQTNVPANLNNVIAIAAGSSHSLALKADGTVVGWGLNNRGQITIPAGLSGVRRIAAGEAHSLAVKADGTIVGWGFNNNGQVTIPAGIRGAIAVAAGREHSFAIYDNTPPVANPTQSPPPAPSGWNNTNVTVNWNWSDPSSGIDPANCTTSSVASGSATVTVTATCRDLAGNSGTATYSVRIDPTAPTANPSQSPAANGAGWNNTDVTVNWNWTFTGAEIDTANCTTSSTSSGEGTLTLSATCRDVATNQRTVTYGVKVDKTAPVVTVTGVSDGASYTLGSVPTAACSTTDALSGVVTQATLSVTGGNPDGTGSFTATCSSATDVAGNSAAPVSVSYSVTPPPDTTAPVITPNVVGALGSNGWYISDVTVSWSVVDDESAISSQSGCEIQNVTSDTAGVTFTCSATSAGGSSSESVTVKRDATTPVVTVTGVSDGASYTLGSVPTAACDTGDAASGVATQATINVTGGNPDGTGSFTATCSGASDNAGNSAAAVSVSYTVSAPVDACTTTVLRDDFNRANGSLGSKWAGLTGQSFYKIAGNQVDVQLGGPVVWKPTTFGVNQAAFVTLNTLDANSPSQGVLLKVQGGTIPNAGAISVVYDSRAKAVRVSTLRLNTPAWTVYGHTPATFANGDKLTGCVQANGTVRVYQNATLLTTVTLNAADQSFFNGKGGKIGLWTIAALNATFDDFGGGALTGVTSATLDAPVPDELADDGTEITVAENFPTDDIVTPEADAFANRAFLPLVNR